jgi:hypothetical protein
MIQGVSPLGKADALDVVSDCALAAKAAAARTTSGSKIMIGLCWWATDPGRRCL